MSTIRRCSKDNAFKVIVYADVHGNVDALMKFRELDDYKSADLRIFLGDAVAFAPYPNECLKIIFDSGDIFLMGNHENYMAFGMSSEEFPFFKADKFAHQKYMWDKTLPELKEKLKFLNKEYILKTKGKSKLFFTHYVWEKENVIADNPEQPNLKLISEVFKDVDAEYIFYGHEHQPSFFHNEKKYVCVGSLGMKHPANYVLIKIIDNKVEFEHKNFEYDYKKVQREILDLNYPRAKKYADWLDD